MPSWIVVLAVLIVLVAAIIYGLIKDKQKGKCSCGHNCGACGACGKSGGSACRTPKK